MIRYYFCDAITRRVEISLALFFEILILAGFLKCGASRTTWFGSVALNGVEGALGQRLS